MAYDSSTNTFIASEGGSLEGYAERLVQSNQPGAVEFNGFRVEFKPGMTPDDVIAEYRLKAREWLDARTTEYQQNLAAASAALSGLQQADLSSSEVTVPLIGTFLRSLRAAYGVGGDDQNAALNDLAGQCANALRSGGFVLPNGQTNFVLEELSSPRNMYGGAPRIDVDQVAHLLNWRPAGGRPPMGGAI